MAFILLCRLEAVLQADAAVKDQVVRSAVLAVRAEVAKTHKLVRCRCFCIAQALFDFTAGEHLQRTRIQAGKEIFTGSNEWWHP